MRLIDADAFLESEVKRCKCVPLVGSCDRDVESLKLLLAHAPTIDAVPEADLKEFAADVAYQFGYKYGYNGRLHIGTGGLSTLEWAFGILGWDDPHPYPEGECEWEGCHEYATCGTPTPEGYMRVCGKHCAEIWERRNNV